MKTYITLYFTAKHTTQKEVKFLNFSNHRTTIKKNTRVILFDKGNAHKKKENNINTHRRIWKRRCEGKVSTNYLI